MRHDGGAHPAAERLLWRSGRRLRTAPDHTKKPGRPQSSRAFRVPRRLPEDARRCPRLYPRWRPRGSRYCPSVSQPGAPPVRCTGRPRAHLGVRREVDKSVVAAEGERIVFRPGSGRIWPRNRTSSPCTSCRCSLAVEAFIGPGEDDSGANLVDVAVFEFDHPDVAVRAPRDQGQSRRTNPMAGMTYPGRCELHSRAKRPEARLLLQPAARSSGTFFLTLVSPPFFTSKTHHPSGRRPCAANSHGRTLTAALLPPHVGPASGCTGALGRPY